MPSLLTNRTAAVVPTPSLKRCDELRDGFRQLKPEDALPVSDQKSSEAFLLDRATTHVKYLEKTAQQLQTRFEQAESITPLHMYNLISLGPALTAEQRHAAATTVVAAVSQDPGSAWTDI
ncbi:hypothetical protein OG21DRAFT_1490703 [Imleria badia]|nr:hypothetical protein OG21DRAFT_1490703 [Imleria badia]